MASTLKKAPLEVSVTETYSLNDRNHVVKNSIVCKDIRQMNSRIVSVGTAVTQVLAFGAIAEGTYVAADVRHLRITNLDDEHTVVLTSTGIITTVRLAPGASYVLSDLASYETISLEALTAACDVEIFIASVED